MGEVVDVMGAKPLNPPASVSPSPSKFCQTPKAPNAPLSQAVCPPANQLPTKFETPPQPRLTLNPLAHPLCKHYTAGNRW
jgi:hypothetical protein